MTSNVSNIIKPTPADRVFRYVALFFLLVVMVLLTYPLIFVINASFTDPLKLYSSPLLLYPKGFNLGSYSIAFANSDIWIGYRNSLIYTFLGTIVNIVMTILGAYPLSRKDFTGRNVLTFFYSFTMFFSGGLIPYYLVVSGLGLVDNIWTMIIPGAVSVYNMIIMRTFFSTNIPTELEEAAKIDGCSNFRLLLSVVLPLSTPILAVLSLYYGVDHWNGYFHAMIFLNDRNRYPLQLFLREILIQNQMSDMLQIATDEKYAQRMMDQLGLKYVVIVVSTLPIFIIYPFLQKFFNKGVLVGALKG
ncbi:MAG: carbohydrate ABC transporter permease [Clostridia bacterium]|nr:carbohydrate ABC transporter permease [Clostridia bacterium]